MYTKTTNEIFIKNDLAEELIRNERENRLKEAFKVFNKFNNDFDSILKDDWIKIKNKKVYYVKSQNFIIADSTRITCSRDGFKYKFEGYSGRAMEFEEAEKLFYTNKIKNPLVNKDDLIRNINDVYSGHFWSFIACVNKSIEGSLNIEGGMFCGYDFNDEDTIKIPVFDLRNNISILKNFVEEDLILELFSTEEVELFKELQFLYKDNLVIFTEKEIVPSEKLKDLILDDKYSELNNISFKREDILKSITSKKIRLKDETKELVLNNLLNCDKVRADIEPYNLKIIEDPNLGHWDLWNKNDGDESLTIVTDMNLVGRNPLADIKEDGIIGIDFGTKSTVVVYQDGDENTQPMRVGMGQYSKKLDSKHFENPTVMEFINIEDFMKRYESKSGRPDTLWEDITVSHTAFNSLIASKSSEYYSYFNDLKQWAGDRSKQIRIRDKKGFENVLPTFIDIKDDEFNPIELYAYYLGLYINNMHNGIYLYYALSFPVTYEKEVREKIIRSFERGIKKSLPIEVLNDDKAMENFRVIQGASEPAAYAICALQEYGFDPIDDEKIFYGIFDFGGGTTDFDFGIWKSDNEDYDYVINHFGADGDKYLGGENLLELLAFEVFKNNQEQLREEGIAFLKPTECKKFAGSEVLLSNSQEAKLNTKQLMEKLRPLWERHEEYEKLYESGVLKVNLFDKDGKPKMKFELNVKTDELEQIIYKRIEKGVNNFFEALKLTFTLEDTKTMDNIIIFLAGNSSKSKIVSEIFNEKIKEYTSMISKSLKDNKEYFKVYPPLGSIEAIEIQRQRRIEVDEDNITRPTGKTGVAFGLIDGRPGSRIKVISEKKVDEEIKFNYYIGQNSKKLFKVIMDKNIQYNEWIRFRHAKVSEFELYYTNLPEATTNKLSINEVSKKMCRTSITDENAAIYIRAVEPSVIEYTVATEEGIKNKEYMVDAIKVELK
jgi:Molecular chaperone